MPLIPNPLTTAKTGWQVLSWLRRVARRDHSTVYRGNFTKASGGRSQITIVVACAPRSALRHGRALDPHRALAFLNGVVSDGFAMPPSQSSGHAVGYQVGNDAAGGWDPVRAGVVWSNGLVELLVRPRSEIDDEDHLLVDLVSVAKPIYDLATAVRDGRYRRLFGWRTRNRRLDWFVFLTNYASDTTKGQRYWDDLIFPGRRPTFRATNHYGAAPNFGLGAERLRGRRQRTDPEEIVRAVLGDLLRESGWVEGNDDAVADVLTALRSDETPRLLESSEDAHAA
jgi:hypothetical protein